MRSFGFLLMLLLLIGTVSFLYLIFPSKESSIINSGPGMFSIGSTNAMTLTIKRRKLKKQNTDHPREDAVIESSVSLEDYRPIDPIPSSTASIRPGPIQHGTPLMPYIPKPSPPPSQAKRGEFP